MKKELLPEILAATGVVATLIGAIDPLEGSILIVPGTLLVMISAFLKKAVTAETRYRAWTFILIFFGVASLWGLSAVGGIGGTTGISMWWGLLVAPYLVGIPMAIFGPGLPRWAYWAGLIPGLWYLTLAALLLKKAGQYGDMSAKYVVPVIIALGVTIVAGCAWRLGKRANPER